MWRKDRRLAGVTCSFFQHKTGQTSAVSSILLSSPNRFWTSNYATEAEPQPVLSKKERRAEEALKKLLRTKEREKLTKEENAENDRIKEQEQFAKNTQALSARLGLSEEIMARALTHSSWAIESNSRVEFLGDKVLGLLLGEHLSMHFPKAPLAAISELFNTFASNAHLCKVGKKLGIQDYIRWRPTEDKSEVAADTTEKGESKDAPGFVKAVADSVEAIIGGIYLEKGLRDARDFVFQHVVPTEQPTELLPYLRHYAPKAALGAFLAKSGESAPYFRLLQESGRYSHNSIYVCGVFVDNKQIGVGSASSILGAEKQAAQDALNKMWGEKSYQTVRSTFEMK